MVVWKITPIIVRQTNKNTTTMNTQTQIAEGTKFTITGRLNGQAGRVFITGKTGIVSDINTVMKGTKFETTTIGFKIEKDSTNVQFGGVCELDKFMSNVSVD